MATIYNPYEDWGYKFTGGAIDSFIRDIEGEETLETYPEFNHRRDYAQELMFELVGQTPCLFYLTRQGQGREPGEQKWGLTIATDSDGLKLPERLEERGLTLGLIAAVNSNGYGGLKILSTRLLSKQKGKQDAFSAPFYLRLRSNYQYRIGVPPETIERMADMPFKQDCIPTEQQLKAWKAFVGVEERLAKEKQFCVPFVSHNYGEATRNITFAVDAESATLNGNAENSLALNDFWQRAKRARNQNIKLKENNSNNSDGRELGTIESIDSESNFLKISLDCEIFDSFAEGHYELPQEGLLSFEAVGDLVQIGWKQNALRNLERGRTQNPYLGQFLFDADQAREPREIVQIQPQDLLLKTTNSSQQAAVETVLSAPDLALIQGPPGTGKTTVIVEICYQVALRGGRTLIASQANLAVDNALSRLQHNPVIRAVRKGNTNSVGIEGEPFLEENVIKNWLQNTSTDCEQRLNAKLELAKILRQLLASSEQFATYLITEGKFEPKQKQLIAHQIILETNYQNKLNTHKIAQDKQQKIESLLTNLKIFLNSQSTVNWDEPWFKKLNPYLNQNASAQELAENIRLAITIVTELSVSYPDLHFLGIAEWFKDHVSRNLTKIQQALNYVEGVAQEIGTLNSKQQLLKQNEDSLERLKKTERQNFDSIQNQQQEIARIQSRQSEISLAQIELEQWLSNAPTQIKTTLKNCLQERRTFSEDLINFPNQLQNLISTVHNLSLQQHLQESLTEFNGLIEKYCQWDKAYVMANELDSILTDIFNKTTIEPPDEDAIVRATKQLTVNQLDFVSALHQLKQITQFRIAEINKPLSFWKRVVEGILAVASKLGWCQPSRRKRAIATLEAVRRQAHLIVRGSEPNNSNIVIESVTPNIVNSTVASTHNWLNELDTQTKQQLQLLEKYLNELDGWLEEIQQQISKAQEELKAVGQDVDLRINSVDKILQKLTQIEQVPTLIKDLAHEYLQNPTRIKVGASELSAQVNYYQNSIDKLETLITSFAPLEILLSTKSKINDELENQNNITLKAHRELQQSEQELKQIKAQLQQHLDNREQQRSWWQEYWQSIPESLKPEVEITDLFELNFLRRFQLQFEVWQQQLGVTETYLNRYQNLISDWIEGLKNPSEQNRHELRRIYLDHANVIGITCSQSAKGNFSREFESFDVVIIDEVSKCTPPELLIPALKAKKLVLVGDHRQLPPMLNDDTIGENAEFGQNSTLRLKAFSCMACKELSRT
jgi:RecA/RadA recombinase